MSNEVRFRAPNGGAKVHTPYVGLPGYEGAKAKYDDQSEGFWERFLFAPQNRRQRINWRSLTANGAMELVGAALFSLVVCYASAYIATGSNSLDAVLQASVSGIVLYLIYGWNYGSFLPRHILPAVSLGYLFVGETGLLFVLGYWVSQFLGALLGTWLASTLIAVPIPVLTLSAGYGFLAIALLTMVIVFNILHNAALDMHQRAALTTADFLRNSYVYHVNGLTAMVLGICIFVGREFGIYLFNPMTYLNTLIFGVGASTGWANYVFSGFVGSLLAALLQLFTANVNGLPVSAYRMAVDQDELSPGSDGTVRDY